MTTGGSGSCALLASSASARGWRWQRNHHQEGATDQWECCRAAQRGTHSSDAATERCPAPPAPPPPRPLTRLRQALAPHRGLPGGAGRAARGGLAAPPGRGVVQHCGQQVVIQGAQLRWGGGHREERGRVRSRGGRLEAGAWIPDLGQARQHCGPAPASASPSRPHAAGRPPHLVQAAAGLQRRGGDGQPAPALHRAVGPGQGRVVGEEGTGAEGVEAQLLCRAGQGRPGGWTGGRAAAAAAAGLRGSQGDRCSVTAGLQAGRPRGLHGTRATGRTAALPALRARPPHPCGTAGAAGRTGRRAGATRRRAAAAGA